MGGNEGMLKAAVQVDAIGVEEQSKLMMMMMKLKNKKEYIEVFYSSRRST